MRTIGLLSLIASCVLFILDTAAIGIVAWKKPSNVNLPQAIGNAYWVTQLTLVITLIAAAVLLCGGIILLSKESNPPA